jgi:hypothetical protein
MTLGDDRLRVLVKSSASENISTPSQLDLAWQEIVDRANSAGSARSRARNRLTVRHLLRRGPGLAAALAATAATIALLVLTGAVHLAGATHHSHPAGTQPATHNAAFKFVPTVTSRISFGRFCNPVISPAPTPGSAADAARAFGAYPGPSAGLGGLIVPGQQLQPIVEYADLSDPADGPIVNGKVQPVYSDTPEWIIEYPSVWVSNTAPFPGATSSIATETILGIVSPGSFTDLGTFTCWPDEVRNRAGTLTVWRRESSCLLCAVFYLFRSLLRSTEYPCPR